MFYYPYNVTFNPPIYYSGDIPPAYIVQVEYGNAYLIINDLEEWIRSSNYLYTLQNTTIDYIIYYQPHSNSHYLQIL